MKTRNALLAVLAAGFFCSAGAAAEQKKWLVVDDMPREAEDGLVGAHQESVFPRLLIMQISKAGVFRCCDRSTYNIQARELAVGESGDGEMTSAGYAISWVMRSQNTEEGNVLTVSLGYNNIGKDGNNELITSEDVMVKERDVRGVDLLTEVARLSARAILFRLRPPQVVEVSADEGDGSVATIDFGRDYFSVGEKVAFTRKVERKGREFYKRIGVGMVVSASADTSCVQLLSGTAQEDDNVELFKAERQRSSAAKYVLAMCYLRGEDVPPDPVKAERLLQEAADGGSEKAKEELKRLRDEHSALELARAEQEKESRKETCTSCSGNGTIECARCKGNGEVIVKETAPCPICSENDSSYDSLRRKGFVKVEVACSNCRGTGGIRVKPRCQFCGGKGRKRVESPGRLPSVVRCDSCGGSGKGVEYSEYCSRCSGSGKIEVERQCSRCEGKGTVPSRSKVTCPVCNGKCKLPCDCCDGEGFTYRPRE